MYEIRATWDLLNLNLPEYLPHTLLLNKLSGVQFGLKSYGSLKNQTSMQSKFYLKSQRRLEVELRS